MYFQHWGSQTEKGAWTDNEGSWRKKKKEKRGVKHTEAKVSSSSSKESGVAQAHAAAQRGTSVFYKDHLPLEAPFSKMLLLGMLRPRMSNSVDQSSSGTSESQLIIYAI